MFIIYRKISPLEWFRSLNLDREFGWGGSLWGNPIFVSLFASCDFGGFSVTKMVPSPAWVITGSKIVNLRMFQKMFCFLPPKKVPLPPAQVPACLPPPNNPVCITFIDSWIQECICNSKVVVHNFACKKLWKRSFDCFFTAGDWWSCFQHGRVAKEEERFFLQCSQPS